MVNRFISAKFVGEALGLPVTSDFTFTSITTDSRQVQAGCLFVAIPGDSFDGHTFISEAIERGARGILATRGKYDSAGAAGSSAQIFEVDDSVSGYRKLAAAWRGQFKIPLIAIAGSEGKTTTKEFLAAILAGKWPQVLKTQGSQNGFVGIPMTLLELSPTHGAAVIEVGIDEIGAMKQHMELVRPTAALLTSVGPEHLEKLKDVETVAREEGLALEFTAATGGMVAISLDDPGIASHWKSLPPGTGTKLAYTLSPEKVSNPEILLGQPLPSLTEIQITTPGWGRQVFSQPLPGRHNASNLLAALSIAYALGLTPTEVRQGLTTFKGAEGRSQLRKLPGEISVICDYYNANPTSIRAGLALLLEVTAQTAGCAHICIADMLELGPNEERFHRELSTLLHPFGLKKAQVYLYGPRMKWLAEELKKSGFSGGFSHFSSHLEIATALQAKLKPHDTLLIKGSRGMKMEQVWKALSGS